MATHSSVLAWRIPGTGEPGGLQSMGSHRVGHDWSDLAAAAAGFSLEKASPLAWKIPWTEEPRRLQSMGSRRVGHDWATSLSLFTSCIGEGNGNPLQCSCLENPRDGRAWWAAIYGVAQSWTRLKRLSNSSSRLLFLKIIISSLDSILPKINYKFFWPLRRLHSTQFIFYPLRKTADYNGTDRELRSVFPEMRNWLTSNKRKGTHKSIFGDVEINNNKNCNKSLLGDTKKPRKVVILLDSRESEYSLLSAWILMHPENPVLYLAHRRCFIDICWIKELGKIF